MLMVNHQHQFINHYSFKLVIFHHFLSSLSLGALLACWLCCPLIHNEVVRPTNYFTSVALTMYHYCPPGHSVAPNRHWQCYTSKQRKMGWSNFWSIIFIISCTWDFKRCEWLFHQPLFLSYNCTEKNSLVCSNHLYNYLLAILAYIHQRKYKLIVKQIHILGTYI